VVVGPEGGLDPGELEAFADAKHLRLGPHILRAETAPIAAVAILLSRAREMSHEWPV
jgi:16S rRNA (uracil1498-N3)-methyltransferase